MKPGAFHALLASGHKLTGPQRRDLLSRSALPDLPGLVSVTANEFYARHFFARWRDDLQAVEGTA